MMLAFQSAGPEMVAMLQIECWFYIWITDAEQTRVGVALFQPPLEIHCATIFDEEISQASTSQGNSCSVSFSRLNGCQGCVLGVASYHADSFSPAQQSWALARTSLCLSVRPSGSSCFMYWCEFS